MRDEDKTKEQLINELREVRKLVRKLESSCIESRKSAETLRYFKKAFETMQIGVTITDLEGNIFYINPADQAMHGYSEEESKNNDISIFAPAKKRKRLSAGELASMKKWKRITINKRKDSSIFPVQLMSDVIKDSEGQPVGIITTCEDITDRKNMENEIKGKIDELERFYEVTIHREAKMKELKKEIKRLQDELSHYKEVLSS
jgi:PAS domain S-box-containing protein